ncbi:MAG TPA: PD-(D/E)XK nuclease family protein, partial [Aquabacterium sp.]|nr:PD-(D/E)XK nuclease family protein [Aquabacterium sp.]
VFMVDCDGEPARSDHHTLLVDWPQGADHPACCAFVANEGSPPASLVAALEDEKRAQQTEECNALYVALTRAREELIFSRTQPHRRHPVASWWQRLWDSQALEDGHRWQAPPSNTSLARPGAPGVATNRLAVLPLLLPPDKAASPRAPEADAATDLAQVLRAHRGRVVHRVLELLTPLPLAARQTAVVERLTRQAWTAMANATDATPAALTREVLLELVAQVQRIATHPESGPWLDPAQVHWAGNEVVLWHEGQILRLDRLVARRKGDALEWWVIDYKLHETPQSVHSYREQLHRYVQAVSELEPRSVVRGAFITGDGGFRPL